MKAGPDGRSMLDRETNGEYHITIAASGNSGGGQQVHMATTNTVYCISASNLLVLLVYDPLANNQQKHQEKIIGRVSLSKLLKYITLCHYF